MSKQKKYLAQKYGAADSLAKIIPLRGKEEGLGVRGVASFGRGLGSSGKYVPSGYSSKMFPDFTLLGKDWISGLFSVGWATSGMVYRGDVWMLSFSDSPNDASGCSLSDILEDHVPQRFFLSVRAARGILDRSERRGVKLPQVLRDALIATAGSKHPSPEPPQSESKEQISGRKHQAMSSELLSEGMMEAQEAAVETPSLPMPSRTEPTKAATRPPINMSSPTRSRKESGKVTTPRKTSSSSRRPSMEAGRGQDGQRAQGTKRSSVLLAPTLSTKNEVASSSTQRAKRYEQSAEMFGRPRRLTPTECERLQGFPDNWTVLIRRDTKPSGTP